MRHTCNIEPGYIYIFEIQTFYFFTRLPHAHLPSSIHLLKCLTLIGSRKFHCSIYFFFLTLFENVLIENGLKVLCPSYHKYTSQFIATSLAPPHAPPLPITLNDVAEELEDNRNKGDDGGVQVATNKTSQAKRKTGCKIDSAGCDEFWMRMSSGGPQLTWHYGTCDLAFRVCS